jgi:hypothetical protein
MEGLYRALLRLYPAEYQATFGCEMVRVFGEASATAKQRRRSGLALFTIRECLGLIKGALVEHSVKRIRQDHYIAGLAGGQPQTQGQGEIAQVRAQLESDLRYMEAAIARHDFPKARFHSDEERRTRLHLERLIEAAGSSQPTRHFNRVWDAEETS